MKKFNIQNRRYIGNKHSLSEWIMEIISKETKGNDVFIDMFSGTSSIAKEAMKKYKKVILNDILYSNNIIYKAFYQKGACNYGKLNNIVDAYNNLKPENIEDNYFSINFGGKFYEREISKVIGYIREDIENKKDNLTAKEYSILLTSLIYTIDKLANTVGHFEAYLKKDIQKKPLNFKLINTSDFDGVEIYRQDANEISKILKGNVAYIDPPYNSRQYSRFYHIYETLVKWDKPELFGVTLKPKPENMSKYCTAKAKEYFKDLVENINAEYLVISYNNTYKPKSKSSQNKIKHEDILSILKEIGETKIYEKSYKFFNAGKTDLKDHKEFLFVTKKYNYSFK